MKFKRLIAFLLDMILVYIFANLLFMVCFNDSYVKNLKSSEEYLSTINSILEANKKEKDKQVILDKTKEINYNFLKSGTTLTIITLTIEIMYFVFAQYFNKGQTLGKKLMKIRIKQQDEEKLNAGLFVLRESVLFVLPIQIIDVICLISTKMNTYFIINNATTNIQNLITIAIIAFILFRSDGRGLHEMLSHTEVVLEEKREK